MPLKINFNKYVLFVSVFVCCLTSLAFGSVVLDSYSFQRFYDPNMSLKSTSSQESTWLQLNESRTHSYERPLLKISSKNDELPNEATLVSQDTPALAFPNPFRLDGGVEIGFYSTQDGSGELYVYDMLGHLRVKKDVLVSNTAYNLFTLARHDFQGGSMSAGAYFYVFVLEGNVIRKGKMGVIP